jgi:hypothetical protein
MRNDAKIYLTTKSADRYGDTLTGILDDARYIYNNAIDVSISMYGTKDAAAVLYSKMRERSYSFDDWTKLELHPRLSDGFDEIDVINFVWTLDLLNFS